MRLNEPHTGMEDIKQLKAAQRAARWPKPFHFSPTLLYFFQPAAQCSSQMGRNLRFSQHESVHPLRQRHVGQPSGRQRNLSF